jgi:hypothetical protein
MVWYGGSYHAIIIALYKGLYLAHIMLWYGRSYHAIILDLYRGF